MSTAMYSGVSALKSQQTKLDAIANNIANISTVGYKATTVSFADTLSQTLSAASGATATTGGTNAVQVGTGVSVASTTMDMTNGSLESTGASTDVAISGDGFFIVKNGGSYLFTRDGSFDVDSSGNLTVDGYTVCGWTSYTENSDGTYTFDTTSGVEALNLFSDSTNGNKLTLDPKATDSSTITGQVNSSVSAATQAVSGSSTTATSNAAGLTSIASAISSFCSSGDTFKINDTTITVSDYDGDGTLTVADLISTINAQAGTTGVTASFVDNNGNGYIQLTSSEYGSDATISLDGTNTILADLFAATSEPTAGTDLGSVALSGLATAATAGSDTGNVDLSGGITPSSDTTLTVTIDGTAYTAAFTSGTTYTSSQILSAINTAIGSAGTATLDSSGHLKVTSASTGTSSSVDLAVTGDDIVGTETATAGAASGGITISSSANTLILTVDSGSATTITIPAGTYNSVADLVAAINTQLTSAGVGTTASVDSSGYLKFTSSTTGSSSNVDVTGGTAKTSLVGTDTTTAGTSGSTAAEVTGTGTAGASTTMTVYDSLGNEYSVDVTIYKYATTTSNDQTLTTYYWKADTDDTGITLSNNSGYIQFDENGNIVTGSNYDSTPTLTVTPTSGAATTSIDLDFSDLTAATNSTSSSTTYTLTNDTDGYTSGSLSSYDISSDGIIYGVYDNGETRPLGMLGLAVFANSSGLEKVGDNMYKTTVNSGDFTGAVAAGTSGAGTLSGGYLEESNVDLSEEFSNMMITQRAYQAGSKVITAADECMKAVINMVG